MVENLDSLKINFDTEGLWVLNITLAIIMFGVALGITMEDFKRLFQNPKILLTGIISQFILLPLVTFIFIKLVNPMPSIVIAFYDNLSIFMNYVHYVLILVIAHNLIALLLGFYFAKAMGLSYKDQKTLSIETGIQNSGLGLLLIFSFFNGLGGMALLVAFWAIWDIFSGLALATYWAKQKTNN